MYVIAFSNLNPVIIRIGELSVSWYSLSYVVGILLAWFYANRIITKFDVGINKQQIEDFVNWAIISIVIGGRLGYCLLYDPYQYLSNPIDILKTYKGGMSFHGGVIGLTLASYLFCRKYKH